MALYTSKDYASGEEIRWCPGCGDYAILKTMKDFLAKKQSPPENNVFVSGIGCAARFPYYMNTYGFHTIHGRAAAVATGIRLVNPYLNIWVISGDGDSLSIGGNHLFHLLRRNINLQYLLMNNEVYGLTKGQYSPTSPRGFRSASSPEGSVECPADAASFVLGSGGKFFARVVDVWYVRLMQLLDESLIFPGTGFIEILQNCIVYHNDAFSDVSNRQLEKDNTLWIEHGKPLIFGKNNEYGVILDVHTLSLKIGDPEHAIVHDERNKILATMLSQMSHPRIFGIIYRDSDAPVYNTLKSTPRVPTQESLEELLKGSYAFSY